MNAEIFTRNVPGMTETLGRKCVGIAGCGGLGSNAAVALVRAGIGGLILADFDKVELSNLNRQYYFISDVGKFKVDALSAHLKAVNPDVKLFLHYEKVTPENVKDMFGKADLLVEAFDRGENKKWLIETWCKSFPQKPIVCGSGVSGLGKTHEMKVIQAGSIVFCGDGKSDMSMGLCSARVAIASNMQANVAIEILMRNANCL